MPFRPATLPYGPGADYYVYPPWGPTALITQGCVPYCPVVFSSEAWADMLQQYGWRLEGDEAKNYKAPSGFHWSDKYHRWTTLTDADWMTMRP